MNLKKKKKRGKRGPKKEEHPPQKRRLCTRVKHNAVNAKACGEKDDKNRGVDEGRKKERRGREKSLAGQTPPRSDSGIKKKNVKKSRRSGSRHSFLRIKKGKTDRGNPERER